MSAKLILTEICVGDGIVPDCEAINTFHYQTDMYVIIIAHVNVFKKNHVILMKRLILVILVEYISISSKYVIVNLCSC